MLRLPPFTYETPRSLADAVARLADLGEEGTAMAGGTDLLPRLKRGQRRVAGVVGLRRVRELQGIGHDGGGTCPGSGTRPGSATRPGSGTRHDRGTRPGIGMRIGAGCTLADVARHPEIRRNYPSLAEALLSIAGPALREMGTLGGNLCIETRCRFFDLPALSRSATGGCLKDGVPVCLAAPGSAVCRAVASSDSAPLLIALGAQVRLVDAAGDRLVPLSELYLDDGLRPLRLRPGEVLAEILLPPPDSVRAAYYKVRRRTTLDFPVAGAAVAFRTESGGRLRDVAVVLTAVGSAPISAGEAARVLEGQAPSAEVLTAAGTAAARAVRPIDNVDTTAGWRKHMIGVALARAVLRAADASPAA